jgi:site-specific DNA-methyltransferase (adenine-specific)
MPAKNRIVFGDNLPVLRKLPPSSVQLIYIDPPFNTGRAQKRKRIKTVRSQDGDRVGFKNRRYKTVPLGETGFGDAFENYLEFLRPRLEEAYRILDPRGSLYLHLDYREVHYCRLFLDELFGPECFRNEIIWAYDYGGRSKARWAPKHDNILYYVKDRSSYTFNHDEIDRIPYMAPGLVGKDKRRRGKVPTDTWWQSIVGTNSKERTGYATQKPLAILRRIIRASSNPGDLVLDFFAGSGTTGFAAYELDRSFVLVDDNPQALEVMAERFRGIDGIEWVGYDPKPRKSSSSDGRPKTA